MSVSVCNFCLLLLVDCCWYSFLYFYMLLLIFLIGARKFALKEGFQEQDNISEKARVRYVYIFCLYYMILENWYMNFVYVLLFSVYYTTLTMNRFGCVSVFCFCFCF